LIDKLPRLAVIQAAGQAHFIGHIKMVLSIFESMKAHTVASAIKIGNPVDYAKAVRALREYQWRGGNRDQIRDYGCRSDD
jgi:threonine synthase